MAGRGPNQQAISRYSARLSIALWVAFAAFAWIAAGLVLSCLMN